MSISFHDFFERLPRFLVTGALATGVHWMLMAIMVMQGFSPVLATALGAAAGLALAYPGHYHFTFQSCRSHLRVFPGFLLTGSFGWLVNLLVFFLLSASVLSTLLVQLAATACATLCNYILSRQFVFSPQSTAHASARDQQS